MTATRSGIPTTYAYSDMRSRLEARWAAFFDLVGWSWVYEPMDCDGYIPDFLIKGPRPLFIEVGPCITRSDYEAKAAKAAKVIDQLGHDVLVVGVDPLPATDPVEWGTVAGWLAETSEGWGLDWDWASWHRCMEPSCGRWAVHHTVMSYTSRPCGHGDGDHFLGRVDPSDIDRLWAQAGNCVQWHPSR